MVCHSRHFYYRYLSHIGLPQPPAKPLRAKQGLGFSVFALRYLRNHYYFLFHTLLRCFSSDGSLRYSYIPTNRNFYHKVTSDEAGRVSPFGNRRIIGFRHLPDEYRCLTRPSSVLHTKASTFCVSKT